jgi:hypothetical protein
MTPPPIPPVVDAPRRMTVKYSLARPDILRWQFYLLIRNRVLIAFGLIVSLALVWQALSTPELAARSTGFKIIYALFFTAAMFCIVGSVTMAMMLCMVMFKTYRGFLGDHELEIRDEGLVERTDVNESIHRWVGFHKLVTTGRYLYIYVTDNNVHIVPRRYFASEQGQRAFRDEIERHIKKG